LIRFVFFATLILMEEKTAQIAKEKNPPEGVQPGEVGEQQGEKKFQNVLLIGCVGLVFLVFALICGIGGFWFYQNKIAKGPAVAPTPVVEPTIGVSPALAPTEKVTVMPTVSNNLGRYKNEILGYSFDYPKEWKVLTNKNVYTDCLFGPNATADSGLGGVEVREYAGDLDSYLGYLEKNVDIKYIVKQRTSMEGYEGVEVEYEGFPVSGCGFIIKKDDKIYNVYLNSKDSEKVIIFYQIVASFKF